MKKLLLIAAIGLGLSSFGASESHALDQSIEVGHSTMVVTNVACSTGTASRLNPALPAGWGRNKVTGYLIQNSTTTSSQYVSTNPGLTTDDTDPNRGIKIGPGGSLAVQVYKNQDNELIPLYCRAEDAAGASGSWSSVTWFGTK